MKKIVLLPFLLLFSCESPTSERMSKTVEDQNASTSGIVKATGGGQASLKQGIEAKPTPEDIALTKQRKFAEFNASVDRIVKENEEWQASLKRDMEAKPTPEDVALTKQRQVAYYTGVIASIRSLDDGKSSPDVIGRSAVTENEKLWVSWKEAQTRHLGRGSIGAQLLRENPILGPSGKYFDEATLLVLRHRKGILGWP